MPNSPIFAVLDVGSNSVRLLVGQGPRGVQFHCIPKKSPPACFPAWRAVCSPPLPFAAPPRPSPSWRTKPAPWAPPRWRASAPAPCGTAATGMRSSPWARHAGVELRVLSGEEEAGLAYAGAAPQGRRGVVDIGGGSTELLAGKDGAPLAAYSARMGAVRLAEALGGDLRPGPCWTVPARPWPPPGPP